MDVGTYRNFSSTTRSGFSTLLEKHIIDYRRGEGNLSADTGIALQNKNTLNNQTLSNFSPSALSKYSGYLTAFTSYDKKARFINGVNDGQIGIDKFIKPKSSSAAKPGNTVTVDLVA